MEIDQNDYDTYKYNTNYNTYRTNTIHIVKQNKHLVGWIILTMSLAVVALIFILLWIFGTSSITQQSVCFGAFGVKPGIDGNAATQCGTSGSDLCVFNINSLSGCIDQCNNLSSICNTFSYNSSTQTMRIIQGTINEFASSTSDLYIRQIGPVS